ncbi:DUF2163 domain-containing protein [Stakelama sp. CBK3Z-3]|uniref:DUF2163 domain-containing protein n=1 Tax=Stakelama flava TaxID=2860338 RepID=A0ABS6XKW6_9SPHN|nr:DUF2163 domain-containing protein [Stakelama flava]MBW4330574.1 DUF2163 domain-containing protein [Stakelama flava]
MDWLEGRLTTLTFCWRIERRDGVTIGLTAHDRDLSIDGLSYRAAPGIMPSAIERSADFTPANVEVAGALAAEAITETDLLAGRWDGAAVTLFACDWQGAGEPLTLASGTIGAIAMEAGQFTAELRGIAASLDLPVNEVTSPGCRAELGDARCRVAMAGRRRFARVTAVEDTLVTLDRAEPSANAYGCGTLRWMSGGNCGLRDSIGASEDATVTLRQPPRFTGEGALVELIEGCDKQLATCSGRFSNTANFRGEPYLPGIDLLTRYPGA